MNRKSWIIPFIVMILLFASTFSFADNIDKENLKDKADKKSESILEIIKRKGIHTKNVDYKETLEIFSVNRRINDSANISNLKDIKQRLKETIFTLAITSRKYTIPLYMLVISITIGLISGLGVKSLKKRKAWIVFAMIISVLFLIFINIPLFILYSISKSGQTLKIDYYYNIMYDIVFFLKQNSFTISIILAAYGIINKLLGKNDTPRNAVGDYLLRASAINFITLQSLPILINLII